MAAKRNPAACDCGARSIDLVRSGINGRNTTARSIAQALPGSIRNGKGWLVRCLCPAHGRGNRGPHFIRLPSTAQRCESARSIRRSRSSAGNPHRSSSRSPARNRPSLPQWRRQNRSQNRHRRQEHLHRESAAPPKSSTRESDQCDQHRPEIPSHVRRVLCLMT